MIHHSVRCVTAYRIFELQKISLPCLFLFIVSFRSIISSSSSNRTRIETPRQDICSMNERIFKDCFSLGHFFLPSNGNEHFYYFFSPILCFFFLEFNFFSFEHQIRTMSLSIRKFTRIAFISSQQTIFR